MSRYTPPHIRPALTVRFSAESRLGDIRALIDSYAVEVFKDGMTYCCAPLGVFEISGVPAPAKAPPQFLLLATVNTKLAVDLIRYTPPPEDRNGTRYTRWPFWVEHPLKLSLSLADQWWIYSFAVGKFYEGRSVPSAPVG